MPESADKKDKKKEEKQREEGAKNGAKKDLGNSFPQKPQATADEVRRVCPPTKQLNDIFDPPSTRSG